MSLCRCGLLLDDCAQCVFPSPQVPTSPEAPPIPDASPAGGEFIDCYEREFYVFSNFSSFQLEWAGRHFPTSEHAYHWERFKRSLNPEARAIEDLIQHAESAHAAFKLAQNLKHLQMEGWDSIKRDVMESILRAKVEQHPYVKKKLIESYPRKIVECSWRDDYWGWGPNKDGQNWLGRLWMKIREDYVSASQPAQPESRSVGRTEDGESYRRRLPATEPEGEALVMGKTEIDEMIVRASGCAELWVDAKPLLEEIMRLRVEVARAGSEATSQALAGMEPVECPNCTNGRVIGDDPAVGPWTGICPVCKGTKGFYRKKGEQDGKS